MRLSTYFADAGEVFIYNLRRQPIQDIIPGEYVMVYVQSVGGRHPPKELRPTTERMVKIVPPGQELVRNPKTKEYVAQSFIRFNNHFRNIRRMVLYPTRNSDRVEISNLLSKSQSNEPPVVGNDFIIEEAGIRLATDARANMSFSESDVDPAPEAHDGRLRNLLSNMNDIREKGTVISFGMVVDNASTTGYEFCQVELAAADGDRVLFVAIKISDEDNVSSLCLKVQTQTDDMHDLVIRNFVGDSGGYFITKEYGNLEGESGEKLGAKSHEFYDLAHGESREKEMFRGYSRQVARTLVETDRFDTALFEEWRQMIPPQTIDQHLLDMHELYTQEILRTVGELNRPRLEPVASLGYGAFRHQSQRSIAERNYYLRNTLNCLRDGQMYVASRRRDLEYERKLEFDFGMKIGPHVNAAIMPKSKETAGPATPDLSRSGSTTPTNSPRRKADIARLSIENKELSTENKELSTENEELTTELSQLRQTFINVIKDPTFYPCDKDHPMDAEDRKRFDDERDLIVLLMSAANSDGDSSAADGGILAASTTARTAFRLARYCRSLGPDAETRNATCKARRDAARAARAAANAHLNGRLPDPVVIEYEEDGPETESDVKFRKAVEALRRACGFGTAAGDGAADNTGTAIDDGDADNAGTVVDADTGDAAEVDAADDTGTADDVDIVMDVNARISRNAGAAADNAGTAVYANANAGASTSTNVGASADSDSDSSDDDEDGGVRLVPEPVQTEQQLPVRGPLSKPFSLDGHYDSDSSSSKKSSSKKRRHSDDSGMSARTVSTEDSLSSNNSEGMADSRGGTPDSFPSPKKRKLSHDDDDSMGAGNSNDMQWT